MAQLKIKLVKSLNGRLKKQIATAEQIRAVDIEIEKKKRNGYLPPLPWKCATSVIE